MDYQKHYDLLIDRAKSRVLGGYVERHHIAPRCIGGGDERANLVQLTAEEHYVAHQLLHKIWPSVPGLSFAMIAMTGNRSGKRSNKAYGWVRRQHSSAVSVVSLARWQDQAYRAKHKEAMDGLRGDQEHVKKVADAVSLAHKGRIKSDQERANIAEAGRRRAPRVFSEQAKRNMAEARRKTWAQRKETGDDKLIAAKIRKTRIANGSYKFTEEHRNAIGKASKGRTPWNKGKKLKVIILKPKSGLLPQALSVIREAETR